MVDLNLVQGQFTDEFVTKLVRKASEPMIKNKEAVDDTPLDAELLEVFKKFLQLAIEELNSNNQSTSPAP